MSETVGDYLLERLATWGVKRIYGYPGDGINGIIGAFTRSSNGARRPEFIQVRHEEMAAFMACAHAKFTGEVGVCMATSGPGAIHLLNGLYDAKLDHQPVVAIVGQQARAALGGNYQQEVDLTDALQGRRARVRRTWRWSPAQIRHLVDRALPDRARRAHRHRDRSSPTTSRRPTRSPQPPHKHGTVHSGVRATRRRGSFPRERRPATAPPRCSTPASRSRCWSAQGALHAADEVAEVADLLGAGVAKALLGKAVLPDDLPFVTGSIGLLGTKPSWDLMQELRHAADGRLELPVLGVPARGGPGARRADRHRRPDARASATRWRSTSSATARRRCARCCRCSSTRRTASGARRSRTRSRDWWKLMEAPGACMRADPINPQRVFCELSQAAARRTRSSRSDSGSSANWYARDVKLPPGMMASLSGRWRRWVRACPYAIAAKFAHPGPPGARAGRRRRDADERDQRADHDRQVPRPLARPAAGRARAQQPRPEPGHLGAAGDGGRPEVRGSQDLPDFPYARYAELLGLDGIRVETPDQVAPAWDEALAADRPVVIEAVTDPEVPPLPPHITIEQAKALSSALLRGRPERRADHQAVVQAEGPGVPAGPMSTTVARSPRSRSTSWRSRPTPSRPTRPRPTARSPGTRRRSSSSMPTAAARSGSATRTPTWRRRSWSTSKLAGIVRGATRSRRRPRWAAMVEPTRNLGRPGIASMAIAAVDIALWDLKARLLGAAAVHAARAWLTTACPSTAVGRLHAPTRRSGSRSSSAAGSSRASRG